MRNEHLWRQYSQNYAHYPPGYSRYQRNHDTRLVAVQQNGDYIMEEEMIDL